MSIFGNERRYGLVAQALHWTTAILVLWTWLIAGTWGRDESSAIMGLHQSLGFTVFLLVLARVVWRLFDRRPPAPPVPGLMALGAKLPIGFSTGCWLRSRLPPSSARGLRVTR